MTGGDACPRPLVEFAERLADAARPIARGYFRAGLEIEQKPNATPVTVADREVEAALRALIEREYPGHGIVGEEFGPSRTDAEHVWVIDPIDGTKAFISGVPLFGTLIALTRRGVPLVGVLDQAFTGERWVGARGQPTRHDGHEVRARPRSLPESILCVASPEYFAYPDEGAAFSRLRERVRWVRYGTSCYGYGLLASGHVSLVLDAGLEPYDYLAQVPIIEGAGGVMSDWEGRPLTLACQATRVVAASDAALHGETLSLIGAPG